MQELKSHAKKTLRCAIYTRKSTEEGLEQDFNSLDAQRESAQAFIRSQQREGWKLAPGRYDDGGFTGANMERPALNRLLDAVRAREIDCVVVYKVDRLSRSLLDFARIMSLFDEHEVSFVSVTQQFNTSSSLGRLTLHILLSFAQFERELIGERTRDKMSAARKKGKWTGGSLVLGYDVDPRAKRLIVNPREANHVRAIFTLFEETRSVRLTLDEILRQGWKLKSWTCRNGKVHGGGPFNENALRRMLGSALYTGNVRYKGTIYPGEHEAIIDRASWERVQSLIEHYAPESGPRQKHQALLRGLLHCDSCGVPMLPVHVGRHGHRYRYYVCRTRNKGSAQQCPARSLPAQDIDDAVLNQLKCHSSLEIPADFAARMIYFQERIERVGYDGTTGRIHIRLREPERN